MTFERQPAPIWQDQVPGARWFKGDLQVHTMDDRAGGRAKIPSELAGIADAEEQQRRYARLVLESAISRGIQVLGLTPHSPYHRDSDASAVWSIVDEWNTGSDESGISFRDRIYAVFPGFEPSFEQGRSGLHMLFLFDPEIGPADYRQVFTLIMGGVAPWKDKALQLSTHGFSEAVESLQKFRSNSENAAGWSFVVLAPHIDGDKGLLKAQRAQVLTRFAHRDVAGLELGDNKLPEDTLKERTWLAEGMRKHRQAFFHSSDAYTVSDIGNRFTWFKLASPRIDALRQAMLASDSRVRIAFHRDNQDAFNPSGWSPEATRPWLRKVTVRGDAAFFGLGKGTTFRLSPDLNCIIGGSMTGKSTFLDGLRVHLDAAMPEDKVLHEQVEARGRDNFAAGSPDIKLDCRNGDSTAVLKEEWPAQFFGQNELQRLAQKGAALEEILGRLVPSETVAIESRRVRLGELDGELRDLAAELTALEERRDASEQALHRARNATELLTKFAEVGVEKLARADRLRQAWARLERQARESLEAAIQARASAAELETPDTSDPDLEEALAESPARNAAASLEERRSTILRAHDSTIALHSSWAEDVRRIADAATSYAKKTRTQVERALVADGYDAAKLREFKDISRQAGLLPSYQDSFDSMHKTVVARQGKFDKSRARRRQLVTEQRATFDRVASRVEVEHEGRLRVERLEGGDTTLVEGYLQNLRKRAITKWWNTLSEEQRRDAAARLDGFEDSDLRDVGMSTAVRKTFLETMTAARRRDLRAMRYPDRYEIRYRMDDGEFRSLQELSGGQRVSVLLSLLLKANDQRPLVIDQPEDELVNRVLFDTVLPTLRQQKGHRQVILATHDANIVVNGDADMVILLEADASHGTVARSGAIEMPEVRDAIVRTVDGGEDAFRLRTTKYGF